MTKKVAVITPGGDASGMNACIRAVVRKGISYGFEMLGIYRGYQGLINGEIGTLEKRSVSGIIHHGGTILKSTRCEEIKTPEGIKKAVKVLKGLEVDYLVIIGGDGSFSAGLKMVKYGITMIGIPASIDNDIFGTDETIGFDTAIDVAVDAIDKIRDTATSFDRIFVVEVMGREHGFLAIAVGVASGAEIIIIPEIKYDIKKICGKLIKHKTEHKMSEIIVFAEGAGNVFEFVKQVQQLTGVPTRVSSLGYIQRGGAPSARSRILGSMFGGYAIDLIKKGIKNKVVVLQNNKVTHLPVEKVVGREKKIDKNLYLLAQKLAN